jgi:GMP synthase (glutamine-hydrolysing)
VNILLISCYLSDQLAYFSDHTQEHLLLNDAKWFTASMDGGVRDKITLLNINAYKSSHFPPVEDLSGIIIGGSEYMLSSGNDPWVNRLKKYIENAAGKNTPMLGVCFGHQLLGQTFGAGIENRNPRELGTVTITLSEPGRKDKLFWGLDNQFKVLMAHGDTVEKLTPGIQSLAFNDYTQNQAIAIDDHIRGVQFHPEFSVEIIRAILHSGKEDMAPKDIDIKAVDKHLKNTPDAKTVLNNFINYFVLAPNEQPN